MQDIHSTTVWTGFLGLIGVSAIGLGFMADFAPALIAAGCVACATPIFAERLRLNRRNAADQRERDRLADVDRQIVAVVLRHAALLERRKGQIQAVLGANDAGRAWERDVARFHGKFVAPRIATLRRTETESELICRVQLAADEILALRGRASRRAA